MPHRPSSDPAGAGRRRVAYPLLGAALAIGVGVALSGAFGNAATEEETAPRVSERPRAPLLFGVVPQQSATRLAAAWGPLVEALATELGRPVQFATTRDIPTFEACLAAGRFDIAYMNPHHYVTFSHDADYRVVANQAGRKLRGLVVVRRDAQADTLASLDGTRIAFPSPGAFGASVLPRAEMARQGIAFAPIYTRSHDSVYRAVAAGLAAAGGGVRRTFDAAPAQQRDTLKIIYTTAAYTPHAIAVRGDAARAQATGAALLAAAARAPGLVAALGMSGLQAAADTDYDDVRALGITPEQAGYDQLGEAGCPFD